MGSNPVGVTTSWGYSSAGRARALQARGHRFEPCCPHQKEHANTACFFMLFRPRIVALQLRTFSVPLCLGHTARFAFVSLLTRFAVIRALLSPPKEHANTACFFMLFRPRIVALQLRTFSVPLCLGHTARFAFVSLLTRFAVIRTLLSPPHDNHPHLSHLQERMFYFYHAFCSLKNEQPRTTNHAFLDMSFLAPYFQFVLKNVFYMIRGIGQRGKPYLGGITESHCSCKNNA